VARASFLQRFATFATTLKEKYVQDGALHEREKNAKARLIRNGLAVVGFSFLEDFLRERTAEILTYLAASGVSFNLLPEKVKNGTTFGLLKALASRVQFEYDDAARIAFAQAHAGYIASTGGAPFQLSPLSFGFKNSNIGADEVADIVRAFRINAPWQTFGTLAQRVGLGALPLEDAFTNASKRRHKAAHEAGSTTPHNDLENYVGEATAIAFGFDALLSAAAVKIKRRDPKFAAGQFSLSDLPLVVLSRTRGRYKEHLFGNPRARATDVSLEALESRVLPRADRDGAVVAYSNSLGQLDRWVFPSVS
jgi:hypothetical protein